MSDADCKSVADVPSFTLRTARSAIPLYQTDEALKYNDSIIDLQKLDQTPVNYPCTSILDCLSAQDFFCSRCSVSCEVFCSAQTSLLPMSEQILREHRVHA